MADRAYDRKLYIKTTGIREWEDSKVKFNRCEPTPYKALDRLFQSYRFQRTDKLVDFGSGKGRVAFYIHNKFHIPVTGIEINDITLDEALSNKKSYRYENKNIEAAIRFKYDLAEDYEIKAIDNRFYFFNPFSVEIFKEVVNNILKSVKKNKRSVDVILYYPLAEYKKILQEYTPFKLLNKIRVPGAKDKKEKFLIYRLLEEDIVKIG